MKSKLSRIMTVLLFTVCLIASSCIAISAAAGDKVTSSNFGEMTTLEQAPASFLHLEEGKIKNMTGWGYYNVGGEDVWYFHGDGTATANPEIRFVTEGTDTTKKVNGSYTFAPVEIKGFSFSYKIVNSASGKLADLTDATKNYIVQTLASDGTYPIHVPNIVADGEWYTISIDLSSSMTSSKSAIFDDVNHLFSGFIFKIGALNGELMIKNINVELIEAPESPLTLETAKIKNMTEWGYANIGGEDVWTFYGDGTATANPEIRFVTDGTDTSVKVNGSYTFAPVEVNAFSFSYKLINTDEKGVADLASKNYIVQELASDSTYPIFTPDIVADGQWHTVTIDKTTALYNTSLGNTFDDVNHLFSGFIFKMGGLNGTLMIKDIEIVDANAAPTYTVTFKADGEIVGTAKYTEENKAITEPAVPEKVGYNGAWAAYELTTGDVTVEAVYTPIEYKAYFVHPKTGMPLTAPVSFNVENKASITFPEVPAELQMEGYKASWDKAPADLALEDTTVTLTYEVINYTAYFVHPRTGMMLAAPVSFNVENKDSVVFPEVPAEHQMEGYTASWSMTPAELPLENTNVTITYSPVEYTVTFKADGEVVGTAKYTADNTEITAPAVPEKAGYTGVWAAYELTTGDVTVEAIYTAVEYTVTFKADGADVGTATYTVENKEITAPAVPEKAGYTGAWAAYELTTGDVTVEAIYTAIEYTVTYKAEGNTVGTVKYTVENKNVTAPAVPEKAGYNGAWESKTLTTGDVTVNAVYTAIEYTVTFKADGEVVGTVKYTVENKEITAPAVPEKEDYTGEWEAYTLTMGDLTVNAVYTEIPKSPAGLIIGIVAAVVVVAGAVAFIVIRKKKVV